MLNSFQIWQQKHPEGPDHSTTASDPRGGSPSVTGGAIDTSLDTQPTEGFDLAASMTAASSARCETTQVRSDVDGELVDDSRAGSVGTDASDALNNQTSLPLKSGMQSLPTL
jgi:hypothetical protein